MTKIFKKRILILVTCFVVLLGGAFALYTALHAGTIRLNYPSFDKYPVHGLDISHHQYTIDWETLIKEDAKYVQFVFVKATEGATHIDTKFEENWGAAKKYNVPRGAYHFFTFCTKAEEQAANFIHFVPIDSLDMPPAIDLEFSGNCKAENRLPDLLSEIEMYISIIEKHYKKKVIIYSTYDFYNLYLKDNFKDNPIWIRDIYKEAKLETNRSWTFWQYANKGHLKGIETFIDINVFEGDKVALEKLITDTIK